MRATSFRPSPLYVICDRDVCQRAGWTLPDMASACLEAGATLLQIRAQHAAGGWLLETTEAVVRRAEGSGAIVIVNDRADVARLACAGVHVGQDDLAPAAARTVVGDAVVLGLSTHTDEQIELGLAQRVSYVALGPVFETRSKATGYPAIGIDRVRAAAGRAAARGIPLVAIGGITLDSAGTVIDAGAASVAVIADLLSTGDPARRVREYLDRLHPSARV